MSIKGYNFPTPRKEETIGHFNFTIYSMKFQDSIFNFTWTSEES